MDRDSLRTKEDIRFHAHILSDWLRGRDPVMDLDQFRALWGPPGGLYVLVPSPGQTAPKIELRLNCAVPVPVPPGGETY